jgi:hypothetical protein
LVGQLLGAFIGLIVSLVSGYCFSGLIIAKTIFDICLAVYYWILTVFKLEWAIYSVSARRRLASDLTNSNNTNVFLFEREIDD